MNTQRSADEIEIDALMARLSNGDRSSFDPLFSALYPRALRLAKLRVDTQRAEDIAQNALMKVFANASSFEAGRAVLPWFYAVVANEIRANTRGVWSQKRLSLDSDGKAQAHTLSDGSLDPEATAILREVELAVTHAVEALDTVSANAIRAVLGEGARPAVDDPTFRKRVSRAYARLREALVQK